VDGVQCKGKERGYGAKASLEKFKAELAKAESFEPRLTRWMFATTSPSDASIQKACREIANERKSAGKFDVDILSWDDIQSLVAQHSSDLRDFYRSMRLTFPGFSTALICRRFTRRINSTQSTGPILTRANIAERTMFGYACPLLNSETWGPPLWEDR
jgi:hypothetical protein